jgi:hypothetical protein
MRQLMRELPIVDKLAFAEEVLLDVYLTLSRERDQGHFGKIASLSQRAAMLADEAMDCLGDEK